MSKREQELTCIVCPQGCVIRVSGSVDDLSVEGHACQRGYDYAVKEFTNPERTITSSVKVVGGQLPLVSVKTEKPVPKKRIMELMQEIKKAKVDAPVEVGDVVINDLGGTKIKLIATKKVGKKK